MSSAYRRRMRMFGVEIGAESLLGGSVGNRDTSRILA
jgi:hypothetical protein